MVCLFCFSADRIWRITLSIRPHKAIAESLSQELVPFNVRTLIVQPGGHRTPIISKTQFAGNPSTPYHIDSRWFEDFQSQGGKQPGDPKKAAERIIDVVRGEGAAAGKPWPLWLFLGKDSEDTVRGKIEEVAKNLDQWKDVVRSTGIDK
jgi:NAD(P)-dependent dehydrogenase (short-subunit alcohol dehydrogenase family)